VAVLQELRELAEERLAALSGPPASVVVDWPVMLDDVEEGLAEDVAALLRATDLIGAGDIDGALAEVRAVAGRAANTPLQPAALVLCDRLTQEMAGV
jgi:hypothetical protein